MAAQKIVECVRSFERKEKSRPLQFYRRFAPGIVFASQWAHRTGK